MTISGENKKNKETNTIYLEVLAMATHHFFCLCTSQEESFRSRRNSFLNAYEQFQAV